MKIDEYDLRLFLEYEPCVCIYFLLKNEEVVYVGRSINLAVRLQNHEITDYDRIVYFPVTYKDLSTYEHFYIQKYLPKYNKYGTKKPKPLKPRQEPPNKKHLAMLLSSRTTTTPMSQ